MRFETLEDWLEWQATLHPQAIELGLDRVRSVWRRLTPRSLACKVITVAGTNGKGSCVALLEAILRSASYRVGCYTSPHLVRYNERIVIDGQQATDQAICQAFERVDQARGDITLTYFEFGTLAALDLFNAAALDVVVLEVGLGGRLDAVNIIDPDVALISSVAIDHTDWLGHDREQIAREKAGIMRPGRPVIYAEPDMPESIGEIARTQAAELYRAGLDYHWRHAESGWDWLHPDYPRHSLPLPNLRGEIQLQNAAAVLMALNCLRLELPLDQRAVRIGLQEAQLAGRYQVIGRDPQVILDVAHNAQAAAVLSANLGEMFCHGKTLAVFSMLADKEIAEVVGVLSRRIDEWYLFPIDAPRAASLDQLLQALQAAGVAGERVRRFEDLGAALDAARGEASEEDRLVVFGSFYGVGDALALLE